MSTTSLKNHTVLALLLLGALAAGCATTAQSGPLRLTSAEVEAHGRLGAGSGTSGVSGIETSVLNGAPEHGGLYTILLHIPANTRIEAHQHPDDRNATVLSGTWYFGYGDRFDEQSLKALPAGSFYTEPPSAMHFARTGDTPVVLEITGYGPTGTTYAAH